MDARDRRLGHLALGDSCTSRYVCGVHFYGFPILVIDDHGANSGRTEAYLRIESRWQLYRSLPTRLPEREEEVPQRTIEELASVAAGLREHPIVAAELAEEVPHLLLKFSNGETLFVYGYGWQYECWELSAGDTMVVAGVDGTLAVWLSEELKLAASQV